MDGEEPGGAYSSWGCKELDTAMQLTFTFHFLLVNLDKWDLGGPMPAAPLTQGTNGTFILCSGNKEWYTHFRKQFGIKVRPMK